MSADKPLTDKEAAFVREYLVSRSPTGAYIKAGYAPKTSRQNAPRMMARDSIKAALAREHAIARQDARKTLNDLIETYTHLGFTGMSRFLKIDENGQPQIDLSGCSPADIDLLAEVTVETYMDGKGDAAREVRRIRIKPYDRYKALAQLALHLGLGATLDPGADKFSLAALLKEIIARGTSLPIRPQGPFGTVPPKKDWKN